LRLGATGTGQDDETGFSSGWASPGQSPAHGPAKPFGQDMVETVRTGRDLALDDHQAEMAAADQNLKPYPLDVRLRRHDQGQDEGQRGLVSQDLGPRVFAEEARQGPRSSLKESLHQIGKAHRLEVQLQITDLQTGQLEQGREGSQKPLTTGLDETGIFLTLLAWSPALARLSQQVGESQYGVKG